MVLKRLYFGEGCGSESKKLTCITFVTQVKMFLFNLHFEPSNAQYIED